MRHVTSRRVDDSRHRDRDSDVTHHLPQEMSLRDVVFNYPAIDNHAHPLLKEECRRNLPFEGVISEAQPDAVKDTIHSLPGYRAARQLAELYGLEPDAGWEEIKNHRDGLEYDRLCNMSMQQLGIQCLLLDDGLQGVQEMANDLSWHRRFANNSVYRLVRIEPVAEVRAQLEIECPKDLRMALTVRLKDILKSLSPTDPNVFEVFSSAFSTTLTDLARDPVVVGFKSVVCYRTGLNVCVNPEDLSDVERSVVATVSSWKAGGGSDVLRLADKALNDFVVCTALSVAAEFNKPGECTSIRGCTLSERRGIFIQSNSTLGLVIPTSPSRYPLRLTCSRSSRHTQRRRSSFSTAAIPTPAMRGILHLCTKTSMLTSERYSPLLVGTASALS